MELGNTLNEVLMRMRRFIEKLKHSWRIASGCMHGKDVQSERLTDSGVWLRGPGDVRCPEAV
jgi:hypothetical protein